MAVDDNSNEFAHCFAEINRWNSIIRYRKYFLFLNFHNLKFFNLCQSEREFSIRLVACFGYPYKLIYVK